MKIGLLPEYPLPIVMGGLEIQCLKTLDALKSIDTNLEIELIDYHNKEKKYDLLHIFGNPPNMYEICKHASKSMKIVVSAVCGATNVMSVKSIIRQYLSTILFSVLKEKTDYTRIKYMFTMAKKVVCLNNNEQNYIVSNYHIQKTKTLVIPNGVENSFFNASKDLFFEGYKIRDYVLFTGNIIKRKNPLLLAKILNKLGVEGVFIGNTFKSELEYAKEFEDVINRSKNLLWIKGVSYDDPILPSAYAASKAFCLLSESETQSLSGLEAMAAKKPVIFGDFFYSYQPPFENVVRCNIYNDDDIESSIVKVLNNPDKFVCVLPDEYNWKSVASNLLTIYKEVLKG